MNVLLVGNYEPLAQQSRQRYAEVMQAARAEVPILPLRPTEATL